MGTAPQYMHRLYLFSPFWLGPLTLRNRIVVPPMDQYSAVEGSASDWHRIHYAALAGTGPASAAARGIRVYYPSKR